MTSAWTIRGQTGEDARFGLFSLLLSVSLVLNLLWREGFELGGFHFIVVVAAFWAMARPSSVVRLLLVAALEVVSIAIDMPNVGDHTLLVGVVCACLLAYVAVDSAWVRRLPDGGALFAAAAPFLRAAVIVLYSAAALSKMNSTFLDPELSCAAVMTPSVAWFDRSLLEASWLVTLAIASTILIEASLPILLAFRRTRTAGLILGIGFHLVLALAGNVPFTAVILALYVAFLPADLAPRAVASLAGTRALAIIREARSHPPLTFACLLSAWLAGALLSALAPGVGDALIDNGTRLLIIGEVACAAALALRIRRAGRPPQPTRTRRARPRPASAIFALGIALLIVNGLSPYLGLKTATDFNMFSNLRTEPGRWNHVLIPEGVQVFGYQDDLVELNAEGLPANHLSGDPLIDKIARFQPIPKEDGGPGC